MAKRTKKSEPVQQRTDGWKNVITGIGMSDKDKRTSAAAYVDAISYDGLTTLYRSQDVAARIVDLPAKEELREGFEVKIEEDEESAELCERKLEELRANDSVLQARLWERLYGGAVVLIGASDGIENLEMPLDMKRVKSVDYLSVFDCSEVRVIDFFNNPVAANYGQPRLFEIKPSHLGAQAGALTTRVHASRVLYFGGQNVNRRELVAGSRISRGFGDSVLLRPYSIIRDYAAVWETSGALIQDFGQAVYKIANLAGMLQAGEEQLIVKKMQIVEMMRSSLRAVLLDKDAEDFERKATPMTGLPEMMDRYAVRVAAAAGIPQTVLFGQSPAGLNATGDSDVRFFYDSVKASQKKHLGPQLEKLVKIILNSKDGPTRGKEPEEWCIKFNPLWQMSDLEKADVRLKLAQVDTAYLNAGVVSPEDIVRSRFNGDEIGMDLSVSVEDLLQRESDEAIREQSQLNAASEQMTTQNEEE